MILQDNKPTEWKLIWSDEFNYTGYPDRKKWGYEKGVLRNHEAQYYTERRHQNCRVEGGNLILEAHREDFQGSKFTSASINTFDRFTFQFGRVDVRAKLPKARGTWPAIWMMGDDIYTVGWPRCGEIDIMEHVGYDPGIIHATTHQRDDAGQHTSKSDVIKVPDFGDVFHNYILEWSPEKLDFLVDDRKYLTVPYEGPSKWSFDKHFYLLLNLAIGGDWGGIKGIDEAAFPQRMTVDYVRIYQKR